MLNNPNGVECGTAKSSGPVGSILTVVEVFIDFFLEFRPVAERFTDGGLCKADFVNCYFLESVERWYLRSFVSQFGSEV